MQCWNIMTLAEIIKLDGKLVAKIDGGPVLEIKDTSVGAYEAYCLQAQGRDVFASAKEQKLAADKAKAEALNAKSYTNSGPVKKHPA